MLKSYPYKLSDLSLRAVFTWPCKRASCRRKVYRRCDFGDAPADEKSCHTLCCNRARDKRGFCVRFDLVFLPSYNWDKYKPLGAAFSLANSKKRVPILEKERMNENIGGGAK